MSVDLRDFIARHIDSVELLEVLLLLQRNPEREWTVASVTQELRSSAGSIQKRLEKLVRIGALRAPLPPNGGYAFLPKTEEIAVLIGRLAQVYLEARWRVIDEIYNPAAGLRDFADAFKLVRERDKDDF